MKLTLTVLLLMLFVMFTTTAGAVTATSIEADSVGFVLTPQGRLRLTMTVRPVDDGRPVESSKQTLIYVPRITDALGHQADFPAVALMQPRAYKHYVRSSHRNHPARGAALQLQAGNTRDAYEYNSSIAYSEWMAGATLQLITVDTRCCQATVTRKDTLVASAGLVRFEQRERGGVHDSVVAKSHKAFIDFPVNNTYIDENYHSNARELRRLEQNISEVMNDTTLVIHGVTFHGYASPEGPYDNNERLAQGRTEVMRQYVVRRLRLPDSLVHATYTTENWEGFRQYVEASSLPHRQQIIDIIDHDTLPPDPKLLRLQQLYPDEMAGIVQNCFPQLRYTDYTISYSSVHQGKGPIMVRDTVRIMPTGPDRPDITEQIPMWTPILALKTNLLFDAAMCPNLEVEVPLGFTRWSLMAEWWTPWFRWNGPNKHNLAYELLNLGAELRFWFNRRCHTCRNVLTGAFLGIYGAGGKYDVEWNKTTHEGWQGEYTSYGLTFGAAFPLAPHWNLELSLSGGYVGGPQRYYIGMFNNEHLIWQRNQTLRFIGPTKAKISIAWIIGRPYGRKGNSRKGGAAWL